MVPLGGRWARRPDRLAPSADGRPARLPGKVPSLRFVEQATELVPTPLAR
jgi:hypothetical protein